MWAKTDMAASWTLRVRVVRVGGVQLRVDRETSCAVPTAAMRIPAMAGPIIRAALKDVEFSATAFDRSASPTRSETKVWLAGE
jgi:hypothetical protein